VPHNAFKSIESRGIEVSGNMIQQMQHCKTSKRCSASSFMSREKKRSKGKKISNSTSKWIWNEFELQNSNNQITMKT
jgi:hypothetical protein